MQTGPRFEWLADDAKWRSGATTRSRAAARSPPSPARRRCRSPHQPVRRPHRRHARGERGRGGAARGHRQCARAGRADAQALLQRHRRAGPATHVYAQIVDGSGHVVGNQATPIPVTLDGVAAHDRAPARGDRRGGQGGIRLQAADHAGHDALHPAALRRVDHVRAHRDLAAHIGLTFRTGRWRASPDAGSRGGPPRRHVNPRTRRAAAPPTPARSARPPALRPQLHGRAHEHVGGLAPEPVLVLQPLQHLDQGAPRREVQVEVLVRPSSASGMPVVAK